MVNLAISATHFETYFSRYHNSLDHNIQNRQKVMHFEQENGIKPHFWPPLALIGPFLGFFFRKSGFVAFLH